MSNNSAKGRMRISAEQMQLPKSGARYLKVHTRYKTGTDGISQVPEIVLKGDWLAKLGFQCGELVKLITAGPYLQIIRTVTQNEARKWEQKN